MAEAVAAIGLAASIVTFIDVSTKVLARLREFHSISQTAPGAFQDITTQLPLIVDIMTQIEKGCGDGSLSLDAQHALSHVVNGCFRQITLLDGLVKETLPASTDSRLQRTQKAIASFRKEKDVAVLQRTLETYKSTLALHFSQRSNVKTRIAIAVKENDYYEVPSLQVSQFVERAELLEEIKASFAGASANTPCPKIVILLGMGGQGKTQLALKYCRIAKTSGRFQGIFWVDASSPNTISHGFEIIAAKISRIGCVFDDVESKIAFVKETLGRWKSPWLIVFDNYDQPGEFKNIATYFPNGEGSGILITSRHADSERLGVTIRVMRMAEDEGLELLLRQTKLERSGANILEGRKIIKKLGYLPLAIDQAGAYISTQKLPLSLFMKHYNERKEVVLKHTPPLWEYRKRLGKDKDETLLSVFTTWELSFQQIGKSEKERTMIGHFLSLSAFFDAAGVGEGLFRSYIPSTYRLPRLITQFIRKGLKDQYKPSQWIELFVSEGVWDQYKYQDTIVELLSLSLLQGVNTKDMESQFSMHPLVVDWLKLRIDWKDRQKYAIEATKILTNYINTQDQGTLPLQTRLNILSHVDMCLLNNEDYLRGLDGSNIASLNSLSTFASFYCKHCRYQDAEALYQRTLTGYEKALGLGHRSTLRTVSKIGILYKNQGRLADAEVMYQRALIGKEKALGPDHVSTLDTVNNIGNLYRDQGRLADAEVMYQRALIGKEKALGPDHVSTLNTVYNIGILYKDQGRLADAEVMCQRALIGKEKALGPDHVSTLNTVNNIGILYKDQGRLADAEVMYQRALIGKEKALGPDHVSTLNIVRNIGGLYTDQGRLADADAMYQRALTGYEKALGPDHTSTLRTARNLGSLYKAQGRLADAEAMWARAGHTATEAGDTSS